MDIPKDATVYFIGLQPGDEDFVHQDYGGFNVSKARRILIAHNVQPRLATMSREEIKKQHEARDIEPDRVSWLMLTPKKLYEPLLVIEPEPGADPVVIDGNHRLQAIARVTPQTIDPVIFRVYFYPYEMLNRIRITTIVKYADGRTAPVDHKELLSHAWGKYR